MRDGTKVIERARPPDCGTTHVDIVNGAKGGHSLWNISMK